MSDYLEDVIQRFHEVNVPKHEKPDDIDREGSKMHRVTARIPDYTVYQADRIARLLNYSRNEIIIQALQTFCEKADESILAFANDQQQVGGDDHYMNVYEEQGELFEGDSE